MILRPAQDERTSFSSGAQRLAGLVPRLFGWRPGEFWDTTPAELAAILTALRQAQDERESGASLSRAELDTLLERDRHG